MRESRAQVVQIVRAFEEADPDGHLLPIAARAAATRRAMMVTGLVDYEGNLTDAQLYRNGETVFRRARLLYDGLVRKLPVLGGITHAARHGSGFVPVLMLTAIALGALPSLLLPPAIAPWIVFLLAAWNLSVLGRWIANGFRPIGRSVPRMAAMFVKTSLWRSQRTWKRDCTPGSDRERIGTDALRRFAAIWRRSARRLLEGRTRQLLDIAAMVCGASALVALGWRPSTEATPWLVAAVFLAVVLPRAAMLTAHATRCGRMADDVQIDLKANYFRRVFSEWRGVTKKVEVTPYNHRLEPGTAAALRGTLHDFFGARAGVRLCEPVAAGALPFTCLPSETTPNDEICQTIVYSLLQTPDAEREQNFLRGLRERVARRDGGRLLVIVDTTNAGGWSESRRAERFTQWSEVIGETGLHAVRFDLGAPVDDLKVTDDMSAAFCRGLWPAPGSHTAAKEDGEESTRRPRSATGSA